MFNVMFLKKKKKMIQTGGTGDDSNDDWTTRVSVFPFRECTGLIAFTSQRRHI